jgi:hypothetical protein
MQYTELVKQFPFVNLSQIGASSLQDRTETKYALPAHLLPELFSRMLPHYQILEIDGRRINTYDTLYLDTPALDLYFSHHNNRSIRFKIRFRTYTESRLQFLEIKHKTNKDRTHKDRILLTNTSERITGPAADFLFCSSGWKAESLVPTARIGYSRITFIGKEKGERITFDVDMNCNGFGQQADFSKLVVAEMKQLRSGRCAFKDIVRGMYIREGSLSKYCMSMISLQPRLKANNFKAQMMRINQITHAS